MRELPVGWSWVRLGDLCTPRRSRVDPATRPGTPFIGLEHVESQTMKLLDRGSTDDVRSTAFEFCAGDTLYGRLRPYLNKVFVPDFDGLGSGEFIVFPPSPAFAPGFLAYLLNQREFVSFTSTLDTGDRPRVRWEQIGSFQFGLPPVELQQEIVAAIDEAFSSIRAGDAQVQQAGRRAQTLRAAALRSIDVDGPTGKLGDVLLSLRNGIFVSRPGTLPTARPILRISAVRPGALNPHDVRYVPETLPLRNEEDYRVEEGDLLFTRYNGNAELVGACALVRSTAAGFLYPDKLIRARIRTDLAEPEFVAVMMGHGSSRQYIRSKTKTTAGQAGIAGAELRAVPLLLPPIAEQRAVVQRIRLWSAAEVIADMAVKDALVRSRQLRASIVSSALVGRLPELDASVERGRGLPSMVGAS